MLDIVIIGAGPAGISLAAEAVSLNIPPEKILILEKAHEHSFTIKKYYPDAKLVTANYKGFEPECTGVMCFSDTSKSGMISLLDKAISDYSLSVNYNETVNKIEQSAPERGFKIYTDKDEYSTKVIVISIGILGKPNKPDYKIPPSLRKKVLFDVTSTQISDSKVLIVGGGDSASEYAQYSVQNNCGVTLSYRGSEFKRMNNINRKSIEELSAEGKVNLLLGSNIKKIEDENGRPRAVFNERQFGGETFDFIIYALGGTTPENFLKTIGIEFNGPEPHLKPGYETSIDGLFLTGDLTAGKKGGSIIWAFNSANTAMKKIRENYLNYE